MWRRRVTTVVMAAVSGCSEPATPRDAPFLTGTITSRAPRLIGVSDGSGTRIDSLQAMFVDGGPGCENKALYHLSSDTRVFHGGQPLDTASLTVGRRVSVWAADWILESCPVQAGAALVRVDP